MANFELESNDAGKLVALEGDAGIIDTQLKLLPPSQKILIQPALPDSFPSTSDEDTFNARTYIRNVHEAFTSRSDAARAFLKPSTNTHPRIVLQNGGTSGARAICIAKIASMTNGRIEEAQKVFDEIVKDGVAGLMRPDDIDQKDTTLAVGDGEDHVTNPESVEHPIVKAMKAADSLDRETQGLQPIAERSTSPEFESAVNTNLESSHVVENDSANVLLQPTIYSSSQGEDIVRTVLTVPNRRERFASKGKRTTFGSAPQNSVSRPTTASTLGPVQTPEDTEEDEDEDVDDDVDNISLGGESTFSAPPTPAVYAEALLVEVQSMTPDKVVRKTQSVDMFHPTKRLLSPPLSAKALKHTTSDYHLRGTAYPDGHSINYQTLPRTSFVKASQTTIKRSPTLPSSIRSSNSYAGGVSLATYVDRGQDAFSPVSEEPEPEEPFVPVFPLEEDLVIHLVDDNANVLLESVIDSYKHERYPILPTPALKTQSSDPEQTLARLEQQPKTPRPDSLLSAETDDVGYENRHSYDPYDYSSSPNVKRQWPRPSKTTQSDILESSRPPTPTLTPTLAPLPSSLQDRFIEFTPTDPNNVINVQDSFRQLLSLHFPAGENGFTQYHYPVAPEADRLWKPVFRNDQSTISGNDGRNVDQIIALGCEDGVKQDFFFQMSGQIERLGTKRDGLNRSGKLDIRYLISNVMQNYSSVSGDSSFNLLSNPQALAVLLVPQIEAYLATNASTRLLVLQYPASHLPTVVALRNVLGSDLFKIGGILDSLASDPPSRSRTPNPLSNEAISNRAQSQTRPSHNKTASNKGESISTVPRESSTAEPASTSSINKPANSFSKADYLLPSMATDAEIATFLSSIWKCLMEKSTFYTPEPEPKPIIVERPPMPPPPPTPTASTRRDRMDRERERYKETQNTRDTDKDSSYHSSYRHGGSQSKIARLTGATNSGISAARSNYTPSVISTSTTRPSTRQRDQNADNDSSIASTRHKYAASIASTKTTNSERERRKDKEWENFYIGDEDSEDDDYDRMIMGRAGRRIVPEPEIKVKVQKRDKRKALKWLGLA